MQTRSLATILTAAALAAPATANAQANPDQALRKLASQVTHGWRDHNLTIPQMQHRLATGHRLVVACGYISTIAQMRMQRMGIQARLVNTVTTRPFDGMSDGHTMIEVRIHGQWVLYDLDNNRQPVDAHGQPINVLTFVRQHHRRYRMLADDQAVDFTGATAALHHRFADTFASPAGLERWYDRVLGTPLIQTPLGYAFNAPGQTSRLERLASNYHSVSALAMQRLYR